jgi:hypothetical protein
MSRLVPCAHCDGRGTVLACSPTQKTGAAAPQKGSTVSIVPPRIIASTGTADEVYRDVPPHDHAPTVIAPPHLYPPDPYHGRVVERVLTPVGEVELYTLAREGHVLAFGVGADFGTGLVAWAHLCLEHARGKAVHNNNFGNQAATPAWTGPVAWLRAPELIGGVRSMHTQPLRAYDSPEQGARGYWLRLAEGYPSALATYESGDGDRVARALKVARYYTEDVEVVARGMRLLVAEGRRRFGMGEL